MDNFNNVANNQNNNLNGNQNIALYNNGYNGNQSGNAYPDVNVNPGGDGKNNGSKKLIIILSAIAVVLSAVAVVLLVIYISNSPEKKARKKIDLGQQYIEELEYEEAIASFENALEIDPKNGEAYLGLVEAYRGLEDYDKAIEIAEEGIEVINDAIDEEDDDDVIDEYEDYIKQLEEIKEEVVEAKAEQEELERIASLPYIEVTPFANGAQNLWGRRWDQWNKEDLINTLNITTATGSHYKSSDDKYMYDMSDYGDYVCEYIFEGGANGDRFGGKYINIRNEYSEKVAMFPADYYYQQTVSSPSESWKVYQDGLHDFAIENGIVGENGIMNYCNLSMDMFDGVDEIEINTEFGVGTATIEKKESIMELIIHIPETDEEAIPDIICFRWDYTTNNKDESYTMIGLGNNY